MSYTPTHLSSRGWRIGVVVLCLALLVPTLFFLDGLSEKAVPETRQIRGNFVAVASGGEKDKSRDTVSNRTGTWPFEGSSIRGFQKQKSIPPPEIYSNETQPLRTSLFQRWLDRYVNGTQTAEDPGIPFPVCSFAVNHHYKFIWVRGYKVGTTSLRRPLGYLCEDNYATPKDADLSLCSTEIHRHGDFDPKTVAEWWKEYFVFSVIRNPYTHFASAEGFVGNIMSKTCDRPSFEEVCHDPFLHTKICERDDCCNAAFNYYHFRHQSECLFDHNFNIVVDFLGDTENLEEDFETIVDEINKRRDPSLPPLGGEKLEHKNVRETAGPPKAHEYSYDLYKQNKTCLQSITDFYKRDFDLLGYQRVDHLD